MLGVLILALIGAQTLAGPVGQYQPGNCARYCTPTSKFIYEVGHTYEYEYDLENVIGIDNEAESSRWHMVATVLITPHSTCEFTMQLRGVNVEGEAGSLAARLERYPLTFAFQDGRIEEVCPSSEEDTEVLNLKRGVLSAMQNAMNNFEEDHTVNEVDVNGDCSAAYTIHTTFWGGSVTIEKTKDLNACKERSSHMAGLHGIGYHVDSDYQGIPLIKSSHSCKQEISDHHLHKSTCEESHTLRPFSGENSGATSKSKQKLEFKQKTTPQIIPNVEMGEKTNLLFNHMAASEDDSTMKMNAMQLLTQLTEESEDEVTPALTGKFSHLVSTLRTLSFSSLREIYRKVSQNRRMKSFFMDALPVVGTGPSITMMHEAILTGEVSEAEASSWYTSLSFTTRPTADMLEASLLLITPPAPKQALLGVSAMVNRFCNLNQNCGETREVKTILKRIEALMGSGCRTTTQEEEDNVMVALKAIGNAGRTTNQDILNQCFMEETNSMRVRVAALQAFRRLPCLDSLPAEVLGVYQDTAMDAEMRINAYLTAMHCPTSEIVVQVKETLSSEPVNQVGSFVWTHLTNLQETSEPTKMQAKELVGNDFLKNKFNTNALKHSRNYEVSLFSEEWNAGTLMESNVIFSQSPIPKSMNYNFTVNLFGESFNLFEIGGRAEGVESFFEKFFGPNGYYPEEHIATLLSAMKGKRNSEDDVGKLSSEEMNPRLDGFLRVFGNEIAFGSISKLEDIQELFGGLEGLRNMMRQFMTKKEIDYTKSSHFISAQFTVPTAAGLPLSIDVNGTTLLRLQAKADMTTDSTSRSKEFSGHIKPSAAVEVTTLMSVEAGKVKTGVQVMATMHTSTILDGGFNFEQGKIMNIHLNMPRDRQEIININSKVFVVNALGKKEIEGIANENMEYQLCTGDFTSKPLGVQLCGELQMNTGFPMRGPAHAAIFLEKTDEFSQYMFEVNRENVEDHSSYALTIDTPGSRVNRRQAAALSLDFGTRNINGQLETPFASFGVTGQYLFEPHEKVFDLKSTANGEELLNVRASLDTSHNTRRGSFWTARPQLKVDVYGSNVVDVKTSMEYSDSGKSSIDGIVESMFLREPITLKGNLNSDGEKHTAGLSVRTPLFEGETSAYLNHGRGSISGTYQIHGHDKENFEIMSKVAVSEGIQKEFNGNARIKLSALPVLNTDVEFTGRITPENFDTRVKFEGALNFEAGSKLALVRKSSMNDIQVQISLACPKTQSEYSLQFSHQGTEDTTTTKLSTHTSNSYDFFISSQFTHKRSPLHYGADIIFRTPEKDTRFLGKIIQSSPSDMEAEFDTQWGDDNRLKASGKITNLDNNKQLSLMVKLPQGEPMRMTGAISRNGRSLAAMAQAEYLGEQYASSIDYLNARAEHQLVAKVKTPREKHELHLLGICTHEMKKLTVDLMSYKHVTASLSWSPMSSTLVDGELYWDKNEDSTRMLSFKLENVESSWTFTGTFLTYSMTAQCSANDGNFFGRVAWGDDKEVVANVITTEKETVAILKTPFQGFESQNLSVMSEISQNDLEAKVMATWGSTETFEITIKGNRYVSRTSTQKTGSVEIQCTVCPFLNGFTANYQDEYNPEKVKVNLKTVIRGNTYEALYHSNAHRTRTGISIDAQMELTTPSTRAFGNAIFEYTEDGLHYKEVLSIPYIANHEFESTVKFTSVGEKKSIDTIISYRNSIISPTILKVFLEKEGSSMKLDSTLSYDSMPIFDIDVSGTFVSVGAINGKVDVVFFNDVFTGSFDHVVTHGQNSIISTRVTGQLNGKEVEIHIDGQYSFGSASNELVFDASMLSSWELYNDLRMNLKHSKKNNRYETTLTASKGGSAASVNQDFTFQSIRNFEHNLSVSSPYDNVKYMKLATVQKWDDTDFVHNTEGSWKDQNIATSAHFKQTSSRKASKVTGDVRVETPLTNPLKASFNHLFDGQRYTPGLSIDYANDNLLSIEASGYFGTEEGNGKLIIRPMVGNPTLLSYSYTIEPTNKEGVFSIEYGNDWKWELKERIYEEDGFTNLQWYLNTNGEETNIHFRHRINRTKLEVELALTTPFISDIKVSGLMQSSNRTHALRLAAVYASDQYEINAKAVTHTEGIIMFSLKTPSTNLSANVNFNFSSDEKAIVGSFENDEDRLDCNIKLKANKRGGSLQANVKSPIEGYKKLILNSSFSNGHKNKKFKFHAQKDEYVIDVKGKITFDTVGDVYFAGSLPIETFQAFKLKGHYDFDSEEKRCHMTVESDSMQMELSTKGKVAFSESYIVTEMRSPQLGEQSFRIRFTCRPDSVKLVGDWNEERMEVTGAYDEQSFEVRAHFQDQILSLNGSFDTQFAKLGLQANSERLEASAEFDSFHAQLTLQRNNKEIKFQISVDPTSVNASVRTPFEGYEHISFTSKLSMSSGDKSVDITLLQAEETLLYGHITVSPASLTSIALSGRLSLPVLESELSVDTKYHFGPLSKVASIVLDKNGDKIVAEITAEISSALSEIKATFRSPFEAIAAIDGALRLERRYGQASLTASSNFNGFTLAYKLSVLYGNNQLELTIESPIKNYEQLYLLMEYELTSSEKYTKIVYGVNGERKEFSIGGQYEDDGAETHVYVNTPRYTRSIQGRVRRSLAFMFRDTYSDLAESRVIEISGDLRIQSDTVKGHFKVVTPVSGWEYSEALFNVDFGNSMKSADLEFTNGEKTHKFSSVFEHSSNKLALTIESTFENLEKMHGYIEYDLKSRTNMVKLGFHQGEDSLVIDYKGEVSLYQSDIELNTDIFGTNKFALNYDFSGDDKIGFFEHTHEGVIKEKGKLEFSLPKGYLKIDAMCNHRHPPYSFHLDFSFETDIKTVSFNTEIDGTKHFVEGSLAIKENEILAVMESSFKNYENLQGKVSYNLSDNKKYANVEFNNSGSKVEVHGSIHHHGDSTDVTGSIETPFSDYEKLKFETKVIGGVQPTFELKFQCPNHHFDSVASYKFEQLQSDILVDVETNLVDNGKLKIEGSYNFQTDKKTVDISVTRGSHVENLTAELTYEGSLNKGKVHVEGTSSFFGDFNGGLETDIGTRDHDTITVTFLEQVVRLNLRFRQHEGYIKSYFNEHTWHDLTWDTKYTDTEVVLKSRLEDSGSVIYDVRIQGSCNTVADVKWSLEVQSPYCFMENKFNFDSLKTFKLSGGWLFHGFSKFKVTLDAVALEMPIKLEVNVKLRKQTGDIEVKLCGITDDDIELGLEYTLTNNKIIIELETPLTQSIQIEGSFFSNDDHSYDMKVMGKVGSTQINLEGSLSIEDTEKQIKATINLPFQGFEHLRAAVSFEHEQNYHLLAELEKNEAKIFIDKTITTSPSYFEDSLHFLSPITGYEDLKFNAKVEITPELVQGQVIFDGDILSTGKFSLTTSDEMEKHLFVEVSAPSFNYHLVTFDASIHQNVDKPIISMKLDVDGYTYEVKCQVFANNSVYGGMINVETPMNSLKNLFFEAKYSIRDNHKVDISLKKNDETHLDVSGVLKVAPKEGNANIDIRSSCEDVRHINFHGMYDVNGPQKHVSADMKVNDNSPVKFTAIWSYSSPVFIKITLSTPWEKPNFTLTIESDLQNDNKHMAIKYETPEEHYEITFSRNVSGSESSNSVVISTPLEGYEHTSFKWTMGKESFDATADYAGKRIKLSLDYSCEDDTYSLNATLTTPFSSWESVKLRTYCKIESGFLVTGSFIRKDEKMELVVESNAHRFLVKVNSPYSPLKNFTVDIKVESDDGYELVGTSSWEDTNIELHLLLKDSSIKIDFDSPFEPFKDMHLEGSVENKNNEYIVEGYGKWEEQKVRISGLWLMYEEFGVKTSLEVEIPISGYDKSAIYVDIKKPVSHNGLEAKLVANIPGFETQSIMFSLKHDGFMSADMELIVGNFKSSFTYNINHDSTIGETEVTINGSLPLEHLSKFSFDGKLTAPSNDNMHIHLELHTPSGVNQVRGDFQVKNETIATEVKLELPLFLGLSPVFFSFNLQKKSNTDINLTGLLLLQEKTYEIHTSFLLEDTSLNVLFKETGLYEVTIDLNSRFVEGVSFDISAQFPSATHTLQASFTDTASGLEVRSSIASPLLSNPVDFKISTTYLSDKLGFSGSANAGGHSYTLIIDLGILDSLYFGEAEIEMNDVSQLYIKCNYEPVTADLVIKLPDSDHEFTFLVKSERKMTTINLFGKSPYIPDGMFETTFTLKSDDNARHANLKVVFDHSTHTFTFSQSPTKLEVELDTSLLSTGKLNLVAVGEMETDSANGEVSLTLGNVHHSVKASLNHYLNGDVRVNTPWLSQHEIHTFTKYENVHGKLISADIGYRNGENRFDLMHKYDISDHTFCQASVTFTSSVEGYEHIKLSGHYKHADSNEVEVKLEADDRYIPTFSVIAEYTATPSLLNIGFNFKSSFTEMQDLGFYIAISPTNKEKQKIVVTGPKMNVEISLASHFYEDKFEVSLTTKWNDKHILSSASGEYDNPINLEVHIETPFEGYEHLQYNGKVFWKFEETESDQLRYVTGLEWNEKLIEVRFHFAPGERATLDLTTPFKGYESLRLIVENSMLGEEHHLMASIASNFYIHLNWELTLTFMDVKAVDNPFNNTCSASIKFEDTYGYYSFLLRQSSTINTENNSFRGRYEISGFGNHEVLFVDASKINEEAKLVLANKNREILELRLTIDTHRHIYGASFNLNEYDSFFNEHSGQLFIAPSLSDEMEEWGVRLKFDNNDIFAIKLVMEESKNSLIVVNPFYPVSMYYTYDGSPGKFEVHGEVCWDLNDKLHSTAGAKLYLTTVDDKQMSATIAVPGHRITLEGTYSDAVPGMIKHSLKAGDQNRTFGYNIEVEQMEVDKGYKNRILCRIDTPQYPLELSGNLYVEGYKTFEANVVLDFIEKSEFFFNYHLRRSFDREVEASLKSSLLSFHVKGKARVCGSCDINYVEFENDGVTWFKFKVSEVGDIVFLEAVSESYYLPLSVSGELGQTQENRHFKLKYRAFDYYEGKLYDGEYFGELSHDFRRVTFGEANRFLFEGSVEPWEEGHRVDVQAQGEEHEYHGTVLVDGNPLFVKMDTKADNQSLMTAQFDATDILSTKIFIQPSLFFYVQDTISHYYI